MSASILRRRPDDRPPQREDWGAGVAISVIAHSMLIAALIWGVHWRSNDKDSDSATAELWSAVPEAQAPPPATTPPPPAPEPAPAPQPAPPPPPVAATPKPPDIVLEQEKEKQKLKERREQQEQQARLDKEKADQLKAEQLKAEQLAKADADRKAQAQKQLDAKQLAKLHDENVRRMLGQLDAPADATGTAAKSSGPSPGYAGRIKARIRPNIVLTDAVPGNPQTEVEVRCAPDGTIIGRRITQSSGVKEWDDTVLRAIDKTQVLPRDVDGSVPSSFIISFRPQDVG